jgi:hypothetical protein
MRDELIPFDFLMGKLSEAKNHFERALDCKHTDFDDLYPYMIEHPQFFWYKRYVAWSELLTIVFQKELCQVKCLTAGMKRMILKNMLAKTELHGKDLNVNKRLGLCVIIKNIHRLDMLLSFCTS